MTKSSKANKVNKGAPSGFVISLIFHAAAFFIAGLFVIFTVVNNPEPEFAAPPPIERPRMKLKKPKVKVKKSSQPKPSSRIVAKIKTKQMPEIQLPDLMGTGEGLLGGGDGLGGEFMDLPEIGEMSIFGTPESSGNDLVGTFYDLKRRNNGNWTAAGNDPHSNTICPILRTFLDSGWKKSELERYYHSNKKLYTTTIVIPETPSVAAPLAFGEDPRIGGWAWAALYEGVLVSHEDIRFRFWGMGDNFLGVAVDGETKLAVWLGNYAGSGGSYFGEYARWKAKPTPLTYAYAHEGQWIDLKAGEPHKLQVLICEFDGGGSSFMLCVEVEGEKYPTNPFLGGRTLPIFQTALQSRTQVEDLERVIYPGDASINEGPIFQDFAPKQVAKEDSEPEEEGASVPEVKSTLRTWTLSDGKTIEAELANQTSQTVWMKAGDGREIKLPVDRFSKEDREYLVLCNPPRLRIDFTEKIDTLEQPPNPGDRFNDTRRPVEIRDYTFKTRVKVMDTVRYTYPLTVEYFAIGREREGDHYVLWKRGSKTFTPGKENKFMVEFTSGSPIRRVCKSMQIEAGSRMRGEVYDGYLVTVTDQRGEIIAHRTSNEFLFKYIARLKEVPVTRHFDKECIRVAPPRPINSDREWAIPQGIFDATL